MGYPQHDETEAQASKRSVLYMEDNLQFHDVKFLANNLLDKWFMSELKLTDYKFINLDFVVAKTVST